MIDVALVHTFPLGWEALTRAAVITKERRSLCADIRHGTKADHCQVSCHRNVVCGRAWEAQSPAWLQSTYLVCVLAGTFTQCLRDSPAAMVATTRGPPVAARPSAAETAAKLMEPPMYEAVSAATSFHPSGPSLGPRRTHARAVPISVAREARQKATVVVRALLSNLRQCPGSDGAGVRCVFGWQRHEPGNWRMSPNVLTKIGLQEEQRGCHWHEALPDVSVHRMLHRKKACRHHRLPTLNKSSQARLALHRL